MILSIFRKLNFDQKLVILKTLGHNLTVCFDKQFVSLNIKLNLVYKVQSETTKVYLL